MSKKFRKLIFTSLIATLETLSIVLNPKPSLGAERISFSLPVLGEFNLAIDDLEVFAKEGTITKDFEFYARHLDEETLAQLSQALQQEFDINPTTIRKLTNAPIGEKLLRQLGEVVYTHPERNGIYAIRAAVLLAATDSEGLTAINILFTSLLCQYIYVTKIIPRFTNTLFSIVSNKQQRTNIRRCIL